MDLTVIETARFGKSQDHVPKKVKRNYDQGIRNMRQRPSNYKPPCKKSIKRKIHKINKFHPLSRPKFIKLKPKMFASKKVVKKSLIRVSHSSRGKLKFL